MYLKDNNNVQDRNCTYFFTHLYIFCLETRRWKRVSSYLGKFYEHYTLLFEQYNS